MITRWLIFADDFDSGLIQLAPVAAGQDGFFRLPSLMLHDAPNIESEINDASEDTQTTLEAADDAETEPTDDIWTHLDTPPTKVPEHKTWDSFLACSSSVNYSPLLSEAGPRVYDALLCSSTDPLRLKNVDVPVVEAKAYFSSLFALALGQESVLFVRQDDGQSFRPALPNMRVSGYSMDVLKGLEAQCYDCASFLLGLRSWVQSTYSKRSTRCGVALASALGQILKDVQQHVAVYEHSPRSLLALRSTVKSLLEILKPFRRLTSKLRKGYSDEDVLSIVFHEAYSVDYGEEQLREIMREVLGRVSRPWIEFLEEWIGTRREEGLPLVKSSVGESKGFVKVEMEMIIDDFGQEVEDVDFRLDEAKMPHFMPQDIAKSIFETGKNLRFIRDAHPEHPLANIDILELTQPPKAEWLYDWDAIMDLEKRVLGYRSNLLMAIQQAGPAKKSIVPSQETFTSTDKTELQFFGVGEQRIEELILTSINQFNQPLPDSRTEDSLSRVVRQRLSGTYRPPINKPNFAPHWSLLPVLSFGGIASAQSQVVNQESLKLLFSDHDLRGHLQIHRDFHLFGKGMFASRLSHALFDPDLETAERQAGVARAGGMMGLRLGGRETWPPASSELRLALMGVLAENLDTENCFKKKRLTNLSRDSAEFPGDLSFAVRDLSQEEIDKCMNVDSLEALDFLRLSYKTPAALTHIITPMILVQYDRIFKQLLRILRMVYVVDQLFRDINMKTSRWDNPQDVSYRFAREAHHFVSGITSYFLDAGVAIPWQAFETKLDKIQADLDDPRTYSAPDKTESPDRLREFHSQVLDRIMLALFLRKRQQPVLKLLEEIFSTILQYAKFSRLMALGKNTEEDATTNFSELYRRFKKKIQIFITVCRGLTEKARSSGGRATDELGLKQEGIGEDHMVAQLLMKLDMNNYYAKN